MRSYAKKGALSITVKELRKWLQLTDKYKNFNDLQEYVIKYVQQLMKASGDYCFNYGLNYDERDKRKVHSITFKIFKNGEKYDYNHPFLKIQRLLDEEKKWFMRFTEEEREQLNYVLNGSYDLEAVYKKLSYIHDVIEKAEPVKTQRKTNKYRYTIDILHKDFPPPDH